MDIDGVITIFLFIYLLFTSSKIESIESHCAVKRVLLDSISKSFTIVVEYRFVRSSCLNVNLKEIVATPAFLLISVA